jgi:hypothetical protein
MKQKVELDKQKVVAMLQRDRERSLRKFDLTIVMDRLGFRSFVAEALWDLARQNDITPDEVLWRILSTTYHPDLRKSPKAKACGEAVLAVLSDDSGA